MEGLPEFLRQGLEESCGQGHRAVEQAYADVDRTVGRLYRLLLVIPLGHCVAAAGRAVVMMRVVAVGVVVVADDDSALLALSRLLTMGRRG